jgi:hypothetical protein
LEMCLGVNALALVLNVISEKLGYQRLWWLGGIYSPQPPWQPLAKAAGDGRTGQSGAPPDRYCAMSSVLPRQPTVRVRSWSTVRGFVLLRHQTVRCHTGRSGAPLTLLL